MLPAPLRPTTEVVGDGEYSKELPAAMRMRPATLLQVQRAWELVNIPGREYLPGLMTVHALSTCQLV